MSDPARLRMWTIARDLRMLLIGLENPDVHQDIVYVSLNVPIRCSTTGSLAPWATRRRIRR